MSSWFGVDQVDIVGGSMVAAWRSLHDRSFRNQLVGVGQAISLKWRLVDCSTRTKLIRT